VPTIRLDPATHRAVRDRRGRYLDIVRGLVRDGLDMPPEHDVVSAGAAAEIVGLTVEALERGVAAGGALPETWIDAGGQRRFRLGSLLRWRAADLRARYEMAAEVSRTLSDGEG